MRLIYSAMLRYASALTIGLIATARTAVGFWLGFRPFDDSYITFRYSLNLASGHGFVYNVAEPVLGTTSPLWAIVLACCAAAGVPIESAALVIPLVCDVASAFFLFRLLGLLGFAPAIPLSGALIFLGTFDYFSLARSGMESSFFVSLVLGSLVSLASQRFITAAVFAGLSVLTRPEGGLLVILLPAALWYARPSIRPGVAVAAMSALGAIAGGWAIYAAVTFGSVVPQSVIAKSAAFKDPALAAFSWNNLALFFLKGQHGGEIFERTYLQLTPAVSLLAALGAGMIALDWYRRGEAVEQVALLLYFPCAYVAGLGISHAFTFFPWYYGPVYPFLAALASIGASAIFRGSTPAVLSLAGVLISAQVGAATLVKWPADANFWIEGYSEASEPVLLREPQVVVAAPEIGVVGWRVWPATILDMEGLVTPAAVGTRPDEFFRQVRPEFLILRTDNAAGLLEALQRDGWFADTYELVHARGDPSANREFRTYKRRASSGSR